MAKDEITTDEACEIIKEAKLDIIANATLGLLSRVLQDAGMSVSDIDVALRKMNDQHRVILEAAQLRETA